MLFELNIELSTSQQEMATFLKNVANFLKNVANFMICPKFFVVMLIETVETLE